LVCALQTPASEEEEKHFYLDGEGFDVRPISLSVLPQTGSKFGFI